PPAPARRDAPQQPQSAQTATTAAAPPRSPAQASTETQPATEDRSAKSAEELRRTRSSPLVRNIAREHGIDISQLEGTGMSGRVTKNDILSYIESGASMSPQQAMQTGQTAQAAPPAQAIQAPPPVQPAAEDRV